MIRVVVLVSADDDTRNAAGAVLAWSSRRFVLVLLVVGSVTSMGIPLVISLVGSHDLRSMNFRDACFSRSVRVVPVVSGGGGGGDGGCLGDGDGEECDSACE